MAISHRLHSSMYERPDEGADQKPKRIVFLSVEGNTTEKDYFRFVNKYRDQLSIQSVIHIEILSRWSDDTLSNPDQVLGLLHELKKLQDNGIHPVELCDVLGSEYTMDDITQYCEGRLSKKKAHQFEQDLKSARIDYSYQKFLSEYKGTDNDDVFAVIVDRDTVSHTREQLRKLYKTCEEKGYDCFVSNPCFEFWLLLHVCDVQQEMATCLDELLENKKISVNHTFVSSELTKRACHGKNIRETKFVDTYLNNIDVAIDRSKDFCQDKYGLLDKLGTNIPELFAILRGR